MRRILCISHSVSLHGAERVLLEAVRTWKATGAEVWVVIPSVVKEEGMRAALTEIIGNTHILSLPYRAAGVNLLRTISVWIYNLYAVRKLSRWIREKEIDLIVSNTSITILGAQLSKVTGVRHIWYFHESADSLYGWRSSLTPLYRRWMTPATSCIFLSHAQQSEWEKAISMMLPGEIIHNPLPFIPEIPNKESHRALRIGYAGGFEKRKNIPFLISAIARFHREYPNSELWLMGAKNEQERTAWQARSGEGVRVMTHSAEMAQFYHEIDIFVLPSLAESWGLAAVEAMAAGVCTIISSVSGLREIYKDQEDCLFLSPADEEAWVQAFEKYTDPAARETMAKAGQKRTQTLDLNGCFKEKITHLLCE